MTTPDFKKIAILGPGLLGGSLGMAVRHWMPQTHVTLWGRRESTLIDALELGAADSIATDINQALSGADLVILATPVGVMPSLIKQGSDTLTTTRPLITDVGSVKHMVHQKIGTILTELGIPFIGSHPMAGSEKTGIRAASTYLFQKAPLILTNDENVPAELVAQLRSFWKKVGCHCLELSSTEHDSLIARISHYPHLISALCTTVSIPQGQESQLGRLAGNGLRDTTRIAAGNPDMWAEILMENKTALLPLIQDSLNELLALKELLESPPSSEIQRNINDWLTQAKTKRDKTLS